MSSENPYKKYFKHTYMWIFYALVAIFSYTIVCIPVLSIIGINPLILYSLIIITAFCSLAALVFLFPLSLFIQKIRQNIPPLLLFFIAAIIFLIVTPLMSGPNRFILSGRFIKTQRFTTPSAVLITNVAYIDVHEGNTHNNQFILIRNGSITALGPMTRMPDVETERIINGSGMTALPGLIDARITLSQHGFFNATPFSFYKPVKNHIKKNAYTTLMSGVTTCVEAYGYGISSRLFKEAVNRGSLTGPKILISGAAFVPKKISLFDVLWQIPIHSDEVKIKQRIRAQSDKGIDIVIVSITTNTYTQKMHTAISNTINEARRFGKKVILETTDYTYAEQFLKTRATLISAPFHTINTAIQNNNTDILADFPIMPIPSVGTFFENPTNYTPTAHSIKDSFQRHFNSLYTMITGKNVYFHTYAHYTQTTFLHDSTHSPTSADTAALYRSLNKHGFPPVIASSGGTRGIPHGLLPFLIAYYVQSGIPAETILKNATIDNANRLGIGHITGSLEPYKAADIILVNGNPLDTITSILSAEYVIRDGIIFKEPSGTPSSGPSLTKTLERIFEL